MRQILLCSLESAFDIYNNVRYLRAKHNPGQTMSWRVRRTREIAVSERGVIWYEKSLTCLERSQQLHKNIQNGHLRHNSSSECNFGLKGFSVFVDGLGDVHRQKRQTYLDPQSSLREILAEFNDKLVSN
jgi:hypothetical protein